MKRDFDLGRYGNRLAVFRAWAEKPLTDCFEGLFIEPQSNAARYTCVVHAPIRAHLRQHQNRAHGVCLASFVAIFGLNPVNRYGCCDAAAASLVNRAARTGPEPVPRAIANARVSAGSTGQQFAQTRWVAQRPFGGERRRRIQGSG